MGNEPRNPLLWLIELFSVLTGVAFVISGIANALAFWLAWGLNYFLIATPSDVVMSGFIFVAAISALSLLILPFRFAWGLGRRLGAQEIEEDKAFKAFINEQQQSLDEAKRLNPDDDAVVALQKSIYSAKRWRDERKRRTRITDSVGLAASAIGMIVSIVVAVPSIKRMWNEAVVPRPVWYETGLMTQSSFRVGDVACGQARVLWLGSSAAVLDCPAGLRIIHKLEELQTEPRWGLKPRG